MLYIQNKWNLVLEAFMKLHCACKQWPINVGNTEESYQLFQEQLPDCDAQEQKRKRTPCVLHPREQVNEFCILKKFLLEEI